MLETYLETDTPDYDVKLNRFLANGWYIYSEGLTMTILRKDYLV